MECLYCGNTDFKEKSVQFTTKVREEEVKVVVPAFVCTKCKKPLMDSNQMDQLRKILSFKKSHKKEAYKKTPAFKPISHKFARKLKL